MHPYNGLTRPLRRFAAVILVLLGGPSLVADTPAVPKPDAAQVPVETLFRDPYLTRVRLAPDGRSMAGLNYEPDGAINLALVNFGQSGATILKGSEKLTIYSFVWLNDKSLLIQSARDRIFVDGLYVVDRNDFRSVKPLSLGKNLVIVGRPKARPSNVMLWRPRYDQDLRNDIDLFEISSENPLRQSDGYADTNRIRVRYPEPGEKEGAVLGYESDVVGELALCYLYRDTKVRTMLFNAGAKRWDLLPFAAETTTILAVEPDHEHLWISEYVTGAGYQVCRYSVATGERGTAVVSDSSYNPGEGFAHYSLVENTLVGVSYHQRRLKNAFFHPRFSELQSAVDRLLPHTDNRIVDFDTAERFFLFFSASAQNSGAYFLLDGEQGNLTPIVTTRPWLSGFEFAPTSPIKFTSRDGLQLEGYLTVPKGASAQNKVPLVVLCHGGPWTRDIWAFDDEAQFLASRGYAVLCPNYRGSTGYSPAVSRDWKYEFLKMHEDVTDATLAVGRLEFIDRENIAIMGASFGGYLAVSGAAFEGDLYRCAITNSGVFDWGRQVKNAKWDGRPGVYQMYLDHLGRPGTDDDHFERISPIASADNIRIPVFIAHGRDDNVVDREQSTKLASMLKRRDVPVETFFPDRELHGFSSPENVAKYYMKVEKFLAAHMRRQGSAPVD